MAEAAPAGETEGLLPTAEGEGAPPDGAPDEEAGPSATSKFIDAYDDSSDEEVRVEGGGS